MKQLILAFLLLLAIFISSCGTTTGNPPSSLPSQISVDAQ